MTDSEMLDWLEKQARRSPSGISFDWTPSVDGERSGFRFMRQHFIGEQGNTLRSAIEAAAAVSLPTKVGRRAKFGGGAS